MNLAVVSTAVPALTRYYLITEQLCVLVRWVSDSLSYNTLPHHWAALCTGEVRIWLSVIQYITSSLSSSVYWWGEYLTICHTIHYLITEQLCVLVRWVSDYLCHTRHYLITEQLCVLVRCVSDSLSYKTLPHHWAALCTGEVHIWLSVIQDITSSLSSSVYWWGEYLTICHTIHYLITEQLCVLVRWVSDYLSYNTLPHHWAALCTGEVHIDPPTELPHHLPPHHQPNRHLSTDWHQQAYSRNNNKISHFTCNKYLYSHGWLKK